MKYYTLILVVLLFTYSRGLADISALDRGHRMLIEKGLQIQAQVFPATTNSFDLMRWDESNFTTVNFQWGAWMYYLGDSPGIPWGRWSGGEILRSDELPYLENFVSFQYGDEQDLTIPQNVTNTKNWFDQIKSLYPNVMVFTNQGGGQGISDADMQNYMQEAQPDMIMFDWYVIFNPPLWPGGSPTGLYELMQRYRNLGLAGNDGTGTKPIPYAQYTQAIRPGEYTLSESEVRLQYFTSWAFGYKFLSAFVYNQPSCANPNECADTYSIFFDGPGDANPTPAFYYTAETNRQSRNLGTTLVRLLSTDIRMVMGKHKESLSTVNNDLPQGILAWDASADPYITSINATNLGSKNDGLAGDIVIGYFKPLDESFDGDQYNNQMYFMVVNGLSATYSSAVETKQKIRLNFNFGTSGINRLQRRNRDTGQVEYVTLTSNGGSLYYIDIILDGGTGDLFKFDTGAPFILECGDPGTITDYDLNQDCKINFDDFSILASDWLECTTPNNANCEGWYNFQ